jgi:hypothetical protein
VVLKIAAIAGLSSRGTRKMHKLCCCVCVFRVKNNSDSFHLNYSSKYVRGLVDDSDRPNVESHANDVGQQKSPEDERLLLLLRVRVFWRGGTADLNVS